MGKYKMTQKWLEKLAPDLKMSDLNRISYQQLLNDYAATHERQTTMDFHHQLKGAILDAVDEGLIERDPTRKAIIKGKTPSKNKKIKEKMRHQGLSEDKRCHFRIWLIVNQSIQRMLDCLFFTTGVSVFIDMDRKSSDGLGKNPDAGINCGHLHGTSFIDGFAGVASTEEKTIGAAIGTVGGLVSGMK